MEHIEIMYHDKDIKRVEKIPVGDWIDLCAAEDVEMDPGDFRLISLGVSMRLPDGYEAHIVPRSSTFKNWHILQANSVGIIDNSYSGPDDIWKFPALSIGGSDIHKGDRICQFRIVKRQPEINFIEVETLHGSNRGGFGSTGK